MKSKRSIIAMGAALAAVILVFAGVMIWQGTRPDPDETDTTSERPALIPLISLDRDEVSELIIENEDGKVRISNETVTVTPTPSQTAESDEETTESEEKELTAEQWVLLEPEVTAVNQSLVDSTANSLLTFTIVEDITEDASEDLATYGFEDPLAEITYVLTDGSEQSVQLGSQLQGENRYYAYNESAERLAVVTSPSGLLLRGPSEYVSAQIFPFTDINFLRDFQFSRKSDAFLIKLEGIPFEETEAGQEDSETGGTTPETPAEGQSLPPEWTVLEPLEWKANQNNVPALLTELLALGASEQIALNQDDADQYGLDDPEYVITLGDGDVAVSLTIGSARGDGTSYGMATGIDGIFTVNTQALSKIGMPAIDFFDGFVALESVWTVGAIEAELDGKEFDIEVFSPSPEEKEAAKEAGEDEPQTIYIVNGRNANIQDQNDRSYFSAFYQRLIGVMGRGLDLEAEPELKDPQFTFEFIKRDDSNDVLIELEPRTERTWYIFRNGEYTGFYTDYNDLYGYTTRDRMGLMAAVYRLENAIEGQQSGYYEHPPMDPETGETVVPDESTEAEEN